MVRCGYRGKRIREIEEKWIEENVEKEKEKEIAMDALNTVLEVLRGKADCRFEAINGREFCIFHDPEYWKKHEDEVRKKFLKLLQRDGDKYFVGFNLPAIKFPAAIKGALHMELAKFYGALNANKTRFEVAWFSGATFRDALFNGTTFKSGWFDRVAFQEAWFREATFKEALFSRAVFRGEVDFTGATFQERALFDNVSFQVARFSNTTFQGPALFENAIFEIAVFDDAIFQRRAEFAEARFQEACFRGALFQGVASFRDASFKKEARFEGTTYQREAAFDHTTFQGEARFSNASFQHWALFDGATFQEAKFENTTFQRVLFTRVSFKNVSFDGAKFQEVLFSEAAFEAASFYYTTFQGEATFIKTKFRSAKFFQARFLTDCIFSNIRVSPSDPTDMVELRNVIFKEQEKIVFDNIDVGRTSFINTPVDRVRFRNVDWSGGVYDGKLLLAKYFDKERKNLVKQLKKTSGRSYDEEDIKKFEDYLRRRHDLTLDNVLSVYRSLRENYDYYLRYEESGRFFVEEMRLRRRLIGKEERGGSLWKRLSSYVEWVTMWLYELLALYGESYVRPILWSAALILAFSLVRPIILQGFSPDFILREMKISLLAFFQLYWDLKTLTLIERLVSVPILGTLIIALRRKLERRIRH